MAVPNTSLAIMCKEFANVIRSGLNAAANEIEILIGPPSEAAKDLDDNTLNIFFYRFDPAGFGPGAAVDEPWMIRMHCLITAFGVDDADSDGPRAGENEIRLLGEVMRIFHEAPVMQVINVQPDETKDEEWVRLQVVPQSLSSEEINNIWSSQGDTSFRSSMVYEVALGPVIPSQLSNGDQLVGAIGAHSFSNVDESLYESEDVTASGPVVPAVTVNTENPEWEPQICFVVSGNFSQTLQYEVNSVTTPRVWVAGDTSTTVTLQWQAWDTTDGWREEGAGTDVLPVSEYIDTEVGLPVAEGTLPSMVLPFTDHVGQALLYAVRSYTRYNGQVIEIRSNPLLVSLYAS